MTDVKQALIQARKRITPQGAWVQFELCRSAATLTGHGATPVPYAFCLLGTLSQCSKINPLLDVIYPILRERGFHGSLVEWNDAPGRTQQEVLDLLDEAIASC